MSKTVEDIRKKHKDAKEHRQEYDVFLTSEVGVLLEKIDELRSRLWSVVSEAYSIIINNASGGTTHISARERCRVGQVGYFQASEDELDTTTTDLDQEIRDLEDHIAGLIQTEVERIFREEDPNNLVSHFSDPDEVVRWVADNINERGLQ